MSLASALVNVSLALPKSCVKLMFTIRASPRGIRKEIARHLCHNQINHGFIRRSSPKTVDLVVVLPVLESSAPKVELILGYLADSFAVSEEDYSYVNPCYDAHFYDLLEKAFYVIKSVDQNALSDEDFDILSIADDYEIRSVSSIP